MGARNENPWHNSHLDRSERASIEQGIQGSLSLRKIAESLNRSVSVISYEVKNNRVWIGTQPKKFVPHKI